jgi:D-sedoheptulose 7-phosphate isomerase
MNTASITELPATSHEHQLRHCIARRLRRSITLKQALLADSAFVASLVLLGNNLASAVARGGRIFVSGDEACWGKVMHFHEELLARFRSNRDARPSIPLAPSLLASGFTVPFNKDDFLIVFSSSKRSTKAAHSLIAPSDSMDDAESGIKGGIVAIHPITETSEGTSVESLMTVNLSSDPSNIGTFSLILHLLCEFVEDLNFSPSVAEVMALIADSFSVEEEFYNKLPSLSALKSLSDSLEALLEKRGLLLLCGNGGSACDVLEFHNLLTSLGRVAPLPLLSLPLLDSGYLTCVGNDWVFEDVYSRGISPWGEKCPPLLIGVSTSGNAKNVLQAFHEAKQRSIPTILLSGSTGGALFNLASSTFLVGSTHSERIQETHDSLLRGIVDYIQTHASCRTAS